MNPISNKKFSDDYKNFVLQEQNVREVNMPIGPPKKFKSSLEKTEKTKETKKQEKESKEKELKRPFE